MTSLLLLHWALAADPSVEQALQQIKSVGKEGAGHEQAKAAVASLTAQGESAVEPILRAFKDASPAAKNWMRMTVDRIVQEDAKKNSRAMVKPFKAVILDATVDPAARAFAYDYLQSNDSNFAKSLLKDFINDPSVELRRMAIADRLAAKPDAETLKALFAATRDKDQAEQIAKLLKEEKIEVNLTEHFGYLTHWQIVGPFDSPEGAGFGQTFPAETNFSKDASFPGKAGATVKWKTITTKANYGMVNLNQDIGKHMDSVAYATTVIKADKAMPCDIRVGSKNAVAIFLNGKKLFEREAYHHGFSMDQHMATGTLNAGENRIVLKVVQNNQKESWAQDWAFNLRVCDFTGGKLPIQTVKE